MLLEDPDHLVRYSANLEVFAERVLLAEQEVHHLGADDAHFAALAQVRVVQEAACDNDGFFQVLMAGVGAANVECRVLGAVADDEFSE